MGKESTRPAALERAARSGANTDLRGNPTISLTDPLLTAGDVAALLGGIPTKTVLQLARERRLPSVRIGRHVRFVRAEIEAALTARRVV